MRAQRVPAMGGGAGVFFLAFLVLRAVPMLADSTLAKAGPVIQVQSVEPAGRNDSYNATSVVDRKDGGGGGGGGGGSSGGTSWSYGWGWGWGTEGGGGGGGGGGGSGGGGGGGGCGGWTRTERHRGGVGAVRARSARRHRPSYSSNLYHVGEYARCTAPGRCRGMQLLCPMHCEGPCFYDCDANCKAHCRF